MGIKSKLNQNSKLMLKIDNLENNDIDSITVFKPGESKACSPTKLFEEDSDKDVTKKRRVGGGTIIINIILIVGIVGVLAMLILFLKEIGS